MSTSALEENIVVSVLGYVQTRRGAQTEENKRYNTGTLVQASANYFIPIFRTVSGDPYVAKLKHRGKVLIAPNPLVYFSIEVASPKMTEKQRREFMSSHLHPD